MSYDGTIFFIMNCSVVQGASLRKASVSRKVECSKRIVSFERHLNALLRWESAAGLRTQSSVNRFMDVQYVYLPHEYNCGPKMNPTVCMRQMMEATPCNLACLQRARCITSVGFQLAGRGWACQLCDSRVPTQDKKYNCKNLWMVRLVAGWFGAISECQPLNAVYGVGCVAKQGNVIAPTVLKI